ncbi:MAG TPA: galactokinase [Candidatus Eisenbacteria bacterium]|nr:galactokinase [Candidatus Eisenbacteria bacterium]
MSPVSAFEARFGRSAEVEARAPGRVNLIGEHIDYNGGHVLPTPIPRHASVALASREDRAGRVASRNAGEPGVVESFDLDAPSPSGSWADYAQGAAALLEGEGFELSGFDALLDSTVPIGSGLASSAAITVAFLRALRRRYDLRLDDERIAVLAQRVENEFVGARVGAMDPMVSSLGRLGSALLIDTRDRKHRLIPIPEPVEIVVVDSGVPHRHAGGEYNRRREECERAREVLGVTFLCDLEERDLPRVAALPEPLARRARHAITEDRRVRDLVVLLEEGRFDAIGPLLDEGHRSLRDDFEVSTPEINLLVALLAAEESVLGARLTGGGFGGSVVAVARAGAGRAAAARAVERYRKETGVPGAVVTPDAVPAPEHEAV